MTDYKTIHQNHTGKVSDKWASYLEVYGEVLRPYVGKNARLLEIGIQNGGSLEIETEFLENPDCVVGVDIDERCHALKYTEKAIDVIVGDAVSPSVFEEVTSISNFFDIVIDDGSHSSGDIVKAFALYFPLVSDGGVFIAEDLHCSYWTGWEGGLYHPLSSIAFFKALADLVNYEFWGVSKHRYEFLNHFKQHYGCEFLESQLEKIHSITFKNSVCIIRKKAAVLNQLGTRVVVGTEALTDDNPLSFNGSLMIPPDEASSQWANDPFRHPVDIGELHRLPGIISKNSQLQAENAQLQAEKSQLEAEKRQIELKRHAEIQNLHQTIHEIRGSLSWLLTRPIRWIGGSLKNRKNIVSVVRASYKIYGIFGTIKRGVTILKLGSLSAVKDRITGDYYSKQNSEAIDERGACATASTYFYRAPILTNRISNEIEGFKYNPLISVVMPVYNVSPVWLIKAYESLTAQWYSNWELCICDDASTNEETLLCLSQLAEKDARVKVKYSNENGNISVASNVALNLAEGEYVALMDNDDELTVDALYEVVKSLQHHKYSFIYSDEDKIELNGDFVDPHFKPDFNPDMFMSHNYISHLGVVEKSLIRKIGGWRKGYEGAQDYDLYLRLLEISLDILHIPKVLYHWRKIPGSTAAEFNGKSYAQEAGRKALEDAVKRRNLDAVVINGKTAGTYRVKYEIKNNPLVSVIIPFRDKPKLLRLCLSSIFDHDSYNNLQIICMDNASVDPEIVRVKEKYKGNPRVEFYSYPYEFNYSAINNYAVNNYAKGEYIIFLNNDIEITQDEWIQAMLELAQTEQAGAVGTMLLYPDDTVQHAGLITSSDSGHAIISAFKNFSARHNGYFSRLQCICNYSAVTAAMMMIKKSKFEEVGGFDEERLPIAYNDVDLCLKLIDKGYRNIYTPYCSAYHHESASRGFDDSLEKVNRQRRELNIMKQKHRSKFRKFEIKFKS